MATVQQQPNYRRMVRSLRQIHAMRNCCIGARAAFQRLAADRDSLGHAELQAIIDRLDEVIRESKGLMSAARAPVPQPGIEMQRVARAVRAPARRADRVRLRPRLDQRHEPLVKVVDAHDVHSRHASWCASVRVQSITISESQRISIDGERLSCDECEQFARLDGFRDFADMMNFWNGRRPVDPDAIESLANVARRARACSKGSG